MYSNYNMPNFGKNMPRGGFRNPRRNDRFGGGFFVPFVLGGITGSLLARPGYGWGYPQPYPYPYPVPYYVEQPFPTYSQNYYYY